MMRARNVKATLLASAAWLMCAAATVEAAMYKWTDESGVATYSNQPPMEPDKVRDLAVTETTTTPAVPRREAQGVDREKVSTASTQARPEPSSYTRAPAKFGESFRAEVPRSLENSASTKQDLDTGIRELARLQARGRTEAVRDPCLISSDPRCYERNKDRYHPYFGYAPSMTQPAATVGTGVTNVTGAGGAVAGTVPRESAPAARRLEPTPPLAIGPR